MLAYLAADDPINEAIDLAGLTPTPRPRARSPRRSCPYYDKLYREKFGAKVLGRLVLSRRRCSTAMPTIKSLADIKGKKVRTASRTQAELVEALGGTPVTMSFGEVVPAMQNKVVDCAITGTLSGNFGQVVRGVHPHARRCR